MDLIYILDFEKMVPAADRSKLISSTLFRSGRNLFRVGIGQRAALLGEFSILRVPKTTLDHVLRTFAQNIVEFGMTECDRPSSAGATRDITEDLIHQLPYAWPCLIGMHGGPHQPHAAIDIETYAAGGNDAGRPISRRYSADRETVALVKVRHSKAWADNAGEHGYVHCLFQRSVLANVIEQFSTCVNNHVGTHSATFVSGNAVFRSVNRLEIHNRLLNIEIDLAKPACPILLDLQLVVRDTLDDQLSWVTFCIAPLAQRFS
jgi:hypothetical protein